MNTVNVLGKNIKRMRQKKGWTMSQISSSLKISISAYSKIETGITDCNISRVKQLAKVLGVETIDLLFEKGTPPDPIAARSINHLKNKINEYNQELINLQNKAIKLHEILEVNNQDPG